MINVECRLIVSLTLKCVILIEIYWLFDIFIPLIINDRYDTIFTISKRIGGLLRHAAYVRDRQNRL